MPLIDEAIVRHLERSRATAATFAMTKNDDSIYERGYGWLDADRTRVTLPSTPMRIASISKPITAAAIRKLEAAERLKLDAKAMPLLKRALGAATPSDPRWKEVTIDELLDHKGGWDIKLLGFDPMFESRRVHNELGLDHSPGPIDVIRWMLDKPLQFDPGARSAYSNFGYCVLGRVIEAVGRRPYLQFVQQEIGQSAGIAPKDIAVAYEDPTRRDPREPWYNEILYVDWMDAHGGIVISSPSLCQFLESYWISGKPRAPGETGYVYTFHGSMPGTSAIAHQRADGSNFSCAFNGRHGDADLDKLTAEINRVIDGLAR